GEEIGAVEDDIPVNEEEPFPAGALRAESAGMALPEPALRQCRVVDDLQTSAGRGLSGQTVEDRPGGVRRSVIHNDDPEAVVALLEEAPDRHLDALRFIAGRDDDGERGERTACIFRGPEDLRQEPDLPERRARR